MKRTELLRVLQELEPVVASDSANEEMTHFRFAGDVVRVTNGVQQAEAKLPEPSGITCLVPASRFVRLLSSFGKEELVLSHDDEKHHLNIKCGDCNARYSTLEDAGILDKLDFDVSDWIPVPKGMVDSIAAVRFAASKEIVRGPLCGVRVVDGVAIGSNGAAIAAAYFSSSDAAVLKTGFILPLATADMLAKNSDQVDAFSLKESRAYFRLKTGVVFGGSVLPGTYPDALKFLERSTAFNQSFEFPETVISVLSRHEGQQDGVPDRDREVQVGVSQDKLSVVTKAAVVLELVDTVSLGNSLDRSFSFRTHPGMFSGILKRCKVMQYGDEDFVSFGNKEIKEGSSFAPTYLVVVERA